jgi:hypothetical protein
VPGDWAERRDDPFDLELYFAEEFGVEELLPADDAGESLSATACPS